MTRAAALIATLAALAACVPEEGPLMQPGSDCMRCHGGGEAPTWTIAGTVYRTSDADPGAGLRGVRVQVTDASGWSFTLRSNQAGNFYSAEAVAFPLRVCLEDGSSTACMPDPVPRGSCNSCHTQPPQNFAPGRVYLP